MSPLPRSHAQTTSPEVSRGAVLVLGVAFLAAALSGCSLPTTQEPPPDTDPSEAPIGSSTPDPARDALVTEVERLSTTVAEARGALAEAVDAGSVDAATGAVEAALDLLVADVGAVGADQGDGPRPLFPSETLDRGETEDAADQLTLTLTRARDVGGSLGNAVLDLLRDPIAGDLGAWQRDAAGVLASIDETVRSASNLEEREAAVAELPGLGTRAVAWARLAEDAADAEAATAYAERGVANLEVIEFSLEGLELPS